MFIDRKFGSYVIKPKIVFTVKTSVTENIYCKDGKYYIKFNTNQDFINALREFESKAKPHVSENWISPISNNLCVAKLLRKYNKFETTCSPELDIYDLPLGTTLTLQLEANFIWCQGNNAGLCINIKDIRT